jgi:signal transduction histidine kinase
LQTILAHRGEGGNIAYYSTIVHDLSIQKKMEKQNLEFAVERERFNSFKEFLTTISHDLKTPLSILDLNLYVLEKSDDPELQKRGITTIHEQTKLLQQYILDLLEISHLEQLPDFEFAELNLEQLLVDIIKQFQPHAIEKNLTLTLTAAINLPSVEGDGDELVRAFNNLVGNAINYTPNGGSITVSSNCNSNEVVISVADTGIGISAEALPYIFERAYRAHEARTFHANGTGFGLAIVKKIVELHQGHIDVQSSPSEGSIFRIYLPLSQKLNNPT